MQELLALVTDAPRRRFAADEVVLTDGQDVDALFVLLEGTLRIDKAGTTVAAVTQRGACVGEARIEALPRLDAVAQLREAQPGEARRKPPDEPLERRTPGARHLRALAAVHAQHCVRLRGTRDTKLCSRRQRDHCGRR